MKLGSRFGEQHQGPLQGLGALLFLRVRQSAFGFSSTAVGPMANAGGVPRFLRWDYAGPLSESWVHSVPRVWKRAYSASGAVAHGCWLAGVLAEMDRNARFA